MSEILRNWKNLSEVIFFLSMVANAALFIPQAIKLYQLKDSREVSLITFLGFIIIQVFTALHAYLIGDRLLFTGMLLAMTSCGAVIYLAVLYRLRNRW